VFEIDLIGMTQFRVIGIFILMVVGFCGLLGWCLGWCDAMEQQRREQAESQRCCQERSCVDRLGAATEPL